MDDAALIRIDQMICNLICELRKEPNLTDAFVDRLQRRIYERINLMAETEIEK